MFAKLRNWIETKKLKRKLRLAFNKTLRPYVDSGGYPLVERALVPKVEAYSAMVLLNTQSYDAIISVISSEGFAYTKDTKNELISSADLAHSLYVTSWEDFEGTILHIITNSTSLIQAIRQAKISPPHPKESFPDTDPAEFGLLLQGNIECWWYNFWRPFWHSLTEQEQQQYCFSKDWKEFIEFR